MTIEYDEKGKYYTDVVSKVPVSSLIQTTTHLLRGKVHIRQGERFKDELERGDAFLAVTDVSVLNAAGEALYTAPFMAVQRLQIVWIMPDAESQGDGSE